MRILHTSDWHLGKRLFKLDRFEEHQLFLDWLVDLLREESIDVLLIAGDVFDSPTPPHQSLQQFYRFLHEVSTKTQTDTYLIAGNHDSGLLLEAPSELLRSHRVKVWGKLSPNPEDHWLRIQRAGREVDLCAIPFFRSYELQGEAAAATELLPMLQRYFDREKSVPQILMLHHLAGMFEAAGSEQVISLSGVDSIPIEILRRFDYVALGHIHKPQSLGPSIFYSGSPIPMRFSETIQKSVMLVTVGNEVSLEKRPIPVFRALVTLKTSWEHWRKAVDELIPRQGLAPMVEMQLELDAPKAGLIDEIKEVLTSKGFELLSYLPLFQDRSGETKKSAKLFEMGTLELFEEFFKIKFPEVREVPEEMKADFVALLEKVKDAPDPS